MSIEEAKKDILYECLSRLHKILLSAGHNDMRVHVTLPLRKIGLETIHASKHQHCYTKPTSTGLLAPWRSFIKSTQQAQCY